MSHTLNLQRFHSGREIRVWGKFGDQEYEVWQDGRFVRLCTRKEQQELEGHPRFPPKVPLARVKIDNKEHIVPARNVFGLDRIHPSIVFQFGLMNLLNLQVALIEASEVLLPSHLFGEMVIDNINSVIQFMHGALSLQPSVVAPKFPGGSLTSTVSERPGWSLLRWNEAGEQAPVAYETDSKKMAMVAVRTVFEDSVQKFQAGATILL